MRYIFVNPLPFPTTRAYGVQLAKMSEALLDLGHSVELWVPSYEAPYPGSREPEALKSAYAVKRLPDIRVIEMSITPSMSFGVNILNALWFRWLVREYATKVRKLLKSEDAETIIVTRDPLIVSLLHGISQKIFWEIHTLGKRRTLKKALISADGLLPISQALFNACVELGYPRHAIKLLPSGVDVSRFSEAPSRAEARRLLNLEQNLTLYAFNGRFQEVWKGRDVLLGLAERLTGQERLYLVGDLGGGIDEFKNEATKRGLSLNNVIFAGHAEPLAVPLHLAAADVLLLPNSGKQPIGSRYTSPLKLFEYLAVGRPIVASDVPAIREVLNETNAKFFAPDDVQACLTACRAILSDSIHAGELERNGKELAKSYDWTVRAKEFVSITLERARKQKTIIVPIFDGVISKNIVDSGALKPLVDQGYRVLLWIYESKADYYRKRYGSKGYIIVEYGEPRIPLWVTQLYNFSIDCIPTNSNLTRHVRRMVGKKKYVLGVLRLGLWSLGHIALVRYAFYKLPLIWNIPLKIKAIGQVERPALVFCPTLIWLAEIQLARWAKRQKIPCIGMVKSWDNITTKLVLPVRPDLLIVPNRRCQDEAEKYLGYPREKTVPVGLPQLDRYVEPALLEERGAFFKRMELDPNKPLLLYCAAGLWMAQHEPDVLLWLDQEIERGVFGPLQVLVRMHPKYDCGVQQLEGVKHLVLDRPGTHVVKDLTQWEYEDTDLRHLLSSIRFADVTINTASTMSIEAAYFDKPVINIAIDPRPVPKARSLKQYYVREHYRPIVDSRGVALVGSYDELRTQLLRYLHDPAADHEGRERVIHEQCIDREPKSAKRLSSTLLSLLN